MLHCLPSLQGQLSKIWKISRSLWKAVSCWWWRRPAVGRRGKCLGLTRHPGLQGQPGEGSLHPSGRWEEVRTDTWPLPEATRSLLLPLCILHVQCALNHESLEPLKKKVRETQATFVPQKQSEKHFCRDLFLQGSISNRGQDAQK